MTLDTAPMLRMPRTRIRSESTVMTAPVVVADANCNGDMHEALQVSREAKDKYRAFEREQAAKALQ